MRYLLYGVMAWQAIWSMLFTYAIFNNALDVARDKGQLASVWTFCAIILILLPCSAIAAGWLLRRAFGRARS